MRFWTSDTHFGHLNILAYTGRPWADVDEMREALVRNWNETVAPTDEVIIVGDFAMGRVDETLHVAARLNGDKTLILGNHDRPWRGNHYNEAKATRWYEEYSRYFFLLEGPISVVLDNIPVVVNHFPYKAIERHQDRYDEWAPIFDGKWLIHGHTHEKTQVKPSNYEIHVGIDAWDYRPVAEGELVNIIRNHTH